MSRLKTYPCICIIGAGFSGICAAVKLKLKFGLEILETVEIFEMMDDLGGTWGNNCYPGATSDAPIHLYTYSFEPRYHWKEKYANQPEILEYLKDVSGKHEILKRINLRHQVLKVQWDSHISKWTVVVKNLSSDKEIEREFDIVILGTGLLRSPKIPEIFREFKGPMFHTSRWDKSVDLKDKTIAVVGVGSSGIQAISEISKVAKKLLIYQRRPGWILPKSTYRINAFVRRVFRYIPWLQVVYRWTIYKESERFWHAFATNSASSEKMTQIANSFREEQLLGFPELQKKLTPKDPFGCQRTLFSSDYYDVIKNPRTKLVNSKIENVTDHSIVTAEGSEEIDVIVLATGFNVTDFFFPIEIIDRYGQNVLKNWKESGPELFLGITANSLPNLFFLWGPNTSLSHNSVILMMEIQMDWIIKCIRYMRNENAQIVTIKRTAVEEYMTQIKQNMKGRIWAAPNCHPPTQYVDQGGLIVALYPGTVGSYRALIDNFSKDLLHFE